MGLVEYFAKKKSIDLLTDEEVKEEIHEFVEGAKKITKKLFGEKGGREVLQSLIPIIDMVKSELQEEES